MSAHVPTALGEGAAAATSARARRPLKPLADPTLLDVYRDVFVPHERYPHVWVRWREGWFPTGHRSRAERRVLTRGHILLHLRGQALYAVRWSTEKLTRLAVVDLDDVPGVGTPAERAEIVLGALGRPPHLRLNSSRHLGRLHLYFLFDGWERGARIREIVERCLRRADLPRRGFPELWPNHQVLRLPLGSGSFLRDPVNHAPLHARTEIISRVPRAARAQVEQIRRLLRDRAISMEAWESGGSAEEIEARLPRSLRPETAHLLARFHDHLTSSDEVPTGPAPGAMACAFERFLANQTDVRILRDPEADLRAVAAFASDPTNRISLRELDGVSVAVPVPPEPRAQLELPTAPSHPTPPRAARPAEDRRVILPAFFPKAPAPDYHRLVREGRAGIPGPGRRLDTAMRLAFHFAMTSATEREANTRFSAWLTEGFHDSRDLRTHGASLLAKMLRDARRYQQILFQRRAAGAYYPYPGTGSRSSAARTGSSPREFDEAAVRTLRELRDRFGAGWRRHVRSLATPQDRLRLGEVPDAALGRDLLVLVGFLRYGMRFGGARRVISLSSRALQAIVGGRPLGVPDDGGPPRARYRRARTLLGCLGYLSRRAPARRGVRSALYDVDLTLPSSHDREPGTPPPKSLAPATPRAPEAGGSPLDPPRTLLISLYDSVAASREPPPRDPPEQEPRGPPGTSGEHEGEARKARSEPANR